MTDYCNSTSIGAALLMVANAPEQLNTMFAAATAPDERRSICFGVCDGSRELISKNAPHWFFPTYDRLTSPVLKSAARSGLLEAAEVLLRKGPLENFAQLVDHINTRDDALDFAKPLAVRTGVMRGMLAFTSNSAEEKQTLKKINEDLQWTRPYHI